MFDRFVSWVCLFYMLIGFGFVWMGFMFELWWVVLGFGHLFVGLFVCGCGLFVFVSVWYVLLHLLVGFVGGCVVTGFV